VLTNNIVLLILFILLVKICFLLNLYYFKTNRNTYHQITYNTSRTEVFTAVLLKRQFFWDVTLWQLVKQYRITEKPASPHCQGPRAGIAGQHRWLHTTGVPCALLITTWQLYLNESLYPPTT
jgi:hypothetical protein